MCPARARTGHVTRAPLLREWTSCTGTWCPALAPQLCGDGIRFSKKSCLSLAQAAICALCQNPPHDYPKHISWLAQCIKRLALLGPYPAQPLMGVLHCPIVCEAVRLAKLLNLYCPFMGLSDA